MDRFEYSATNIAVTTKSGNGCYYGNLASLNDIAPQNCSAFVNACIIDWIGAAASFNLYYQGGYIRIMSDISQTISNLKILVTYIVD